MQSSSREFAVLVFGATGFTGAFVAAECLRTSIGKVGLCGRSEEKLKATFNERILPQLGVSSIGEDQYRLVVADVENQAAVLEAVRQADLVIMCAGPFRFFGEPVVRACCEAGTHYIDICGEPEFMETMELKYHDIARSKNIIISSACGFDSVPADLGALFASSVLFHEMDAYPCHVESFLTVSNVKPRSGNYATYESAIHGVTSDGSLSSIRKELSQKRTIARNTFHPRVPKLQRATSMTGTYNEALGSYYVPFPGSDASVVRRTQLFAEGFGGGNETALPPIQYAAYITLPKKSSAFLFAGFGVLAMTLGSFSWGRNILLNHAALFTLGIVGERGSVPNEEHLNCNWQMTIFAKGVKKSMIFGDEAKSDASVLPLNTKVRVVLEGRDPGYTCTAKLVVAMAKTIFSLDSNHTFGGVLTPASVILSGAGYEKTCQIMESFQTCGAFTFSKKVEE